MKTDTWQYHGITGAMLLPAICVDAVALHYMIAREGTTFVEWMWFASPLLAILVCVCFARIQKRLPQLTCQLLSAALCLPAIIASVIAAFLLILVWGIQLLPRLTH